MATEATSDRRAQGGTRRGPPLLLALALPAVALGCDHFDVQPFHGARVLMTLSGATPSAAGHHLELWVRDAADDGPADQDVVRVLASEGGREADGSACLAVDAARSDPRFAACATAAPDHVCLPAAYATVPGLGPFVAQPGADGQTHAMLQDPCIIDALGNLVWEASALDPATGMAQGELAAAAVQKHIDDLTIAAPAPIVAFVSHDDESDSRPKLADLPTAAARLCACRDYWARSAAAYTPNPRQLTAPIHGALLGVADFTTISPPSQLGGISFDTRFALPSARELWLTDTIASVQNLDPAQVDCATHPSTCRGTTILDGVAVAPASGEGPAAIHFELAAPPASTATSGLAGSATIEVGLDHSDDAP